MSPTSAAQPGVGKWLILGTVSLGTFTSFIDGNSVSIALPRMQGTLGVSLDALTWVSVAAFMASLVTTIMGGWCSALLGRRRFYLLSLLGCTVVSILCGMTRTMEMMIPLRVLYGLANGGLVPIAHATILATFPERERGTAMGIYMTAPPASAIAGQLVGGWMVDAYGWPWVFYINALAGLLAFGMAYTVLRDDPAMQRMLTRIDFPGIGLLVVGLIALQLVLQRGARENWFESSFILGATLVALSALTTLVWWELHVNEPVVNLRVLTNRHCLGGVLLVFLSGITIFGGPFLLPLFLQSLRGYPVLDSGIILLPYSLTWLLLSPFAGRLYAHLDCRLLLGSSLGLIIGGYYSMTRFSLDVGGVDMLPGLLFTGAGIAILNTVLPPAAMRTMPRPLLPMAVSLFNMMRRIGGNVGYALVATMVLSRTAVHRAQLVEHVSLYHSNAVSTLDGTFGRLVGAGMPETVAQASALRLLNETVQRQAMMLAFNDIFWIMAILFTIGVPLLWLLGSRARPFASPAPRSPLEVAGVPKSEYKTLAH